MSEELPPSPSSEADDASKAETIRITLPPKQETAAVKRETVRINLPGRPAAPAGGTAPKKETTKLPAGLGGAPVPPAAPSAPSLPPPVARPPIAPPSAPSVPGLSKPGLPPPPRPLNTPSPGAPPMTPAPPALGKPLAGTTPAPKPPSLGGNRPTMPLKPAPPAPGLGSMPTPAPGTLVQKAAAPKKETARITLPPEGTAKPALPKATVKMGQTQPLINRPSSASQPAAALTVAKAPVAPAARGTCGRGRPGLARDRGAHRLPRFLCARPDVLSGSRLSARQLRGARFVLWPTQT